MKLFILKIEESPCSYSLKEASLRIIGSKVVLTCSRKSLVKWAEKDKEDKWMGAWS